METSNQVKKSGETEILHKIVEFSEEFLQSSGSALNYQKITDDILYISGAKYSAFNLYEEDGFHFRTVAISAPEGAIKKVNSLFNHKILGKRWSPDPIRAEKIKSNTATRFSSLSELAGNAIPRPLLSLIEKTFGIGEVVLVNIIKDNLLIGDFNLFMPKNARFKNDNYIEIYSRLTGLIIEHERSVEALKKSELKYKLLFDNMTTGFALHEMIYDKTRNPIDYRFIEVNPAFERLTGLKHSDIIGKTVKESIPGTEQYWIDAYSKVIKTGESIYFLNYAEKLGRWYASWAFKHSENQFATIFSDVTEQKHLEEELQESEEKFRNVVEKVNEAILIIQDEVFVYANNKAIELTHKKYEELIGMSFVDLVWPEDREMVYAKYLDRISGKKFQSSYDFRFIGKNNAPIWAFMSVALIQYKGRSATLILVNDISERKIAEEELENSKKIAERYLNIAAEIILALDTDGNITLLNESGHKLLGYDNNELIGKNWFNTCLPDFVKNEVFAVFKKLINGETENVKTYENEIKTKNGELRTIVWYNTVLRGSDGKLSGLISSGEDTTERKKAEEKLKQQNKAMEATVDGIAILNKQEKYIYLNKAHARIYGYNNPDELIGKSWTVLYDLDELQRFKNTVMPELSSNKQWQGEAIGMKRDGSKFFQSLSLTFLSDGGIICIVRDITERKLFEEKIIHISYHDKLTDIYNRRFFEEEIKRLNTNRQLPLSIIMADLNSLKLANDTFGHTSGDKILKKTAELLKKICRSEDILARWGGDEFVILLPKTSLQDTEEIARRIKTECFKLTVQKIPIGLAMGIASKVDEAQDIEKIILEAESNMYKNKLVEKESNASSIIFALEQALFEKSSETMEHTLRIKDNAIKLAKSIKLTNSQLDEIALLSSLHDIGKVAIPESILLKKGKPNAEEWEILKRHTEIGFNIAQASTQIIHIAKYILSCHENWDGSGYPQGLKGEQIPILSRIIFIADAYDVMTSKRVYKEAISKKEAIKELRRCSGTQFDPVLIEKFIEILSSQK